MSCPERTGQLLSGRNAKEWSYMASAVRGVVNSGFRIGASTGSPAGSGLEAAIPPCPRNTRCSGVGWHRFIPKHLPHDYYHHLFSNRANQINNLNGYFPTLVLILKANRKVLPRQVQITVNLWSSNSGFVGKQAMPPFALGVRR